MSKPRKAVKKDIPAGSTICYQERDIASCWETEIDNTGRVTPLPEHAGNTVVMVVLKKKELTKE